MEPGTLVRHRARPEWGLGVVVAHESGEKIQVVFAMDDCYFEGFSYLNPGTPGDGPVYSILLGS
jgi:hypothetical protein